MTKRTTGFWIFDPAKILTRQQAGGGDPEPDVVFVNMTPLVTPATVVVRVADSSGRYLGELQTWGALDRVTWATDTYGAASMTLDAAVLREAPGLIDYGNRVLIQFDNGLPAWGGVIDVPRSTSRGQVRIQFYAAEYMFGWMEMGQSEDYTGTASNSAPFILRDVLEKSTASEEYQILFEEGDAAVADRVEVKLPVQTLESVAKKLTGLDPAFHWRLEPLTEAYHLSYRLVTFQNWRRDATNDVVLLGGVNFVDFETLEQGPIYNVVTVTPSAAEFSRGSRYYTATDPDSIALHGRRRRFLAVRDADDTSDDLRLLRQYADAELAKYSTPRLKVRGRWLNIDPARYGRFHLGDRVGVELAELGQKDVRTAVVYAMEFDSATGTLSVVLDIEKGGG